MEFDSTGDQTGAPAQAPTNDPLAELVGEGKPFKDMAALAASKVEGDTFIGQLKSENFEMRKAVKEMEDKLSRASTTTEILEAVRSMQTAAPGDSSGKGDEGEGKVITPALTEENIEALIQRTMKQDAQAKTSETNYKLVMDTFMEHFKDADKARIQYKQAALNLDMTEAQLDVYAKQNPHLVLKAAGLEPSFKSSNTPPSYLQTNQNSEHQDTTKNLRDHAWWEQQRKANGNTWYFQPKIQQQYWNDANEIGDSFLPQN